MAMQGIKASWSEHTPHLLLQAHPANKSVPYPSTTRFPQPPATPPSGGGAPPGLHHGEAVRVTAPLTEGGVAGVVSDLLVVWPHRERAREREPDRYTFVALHLGSTTVTAVRVTAPLPEGGVAGVVSDFTVPTFGFGLVSGTCGED
ncbi:hypothetical protein TIFTF001_029003 [Ficus carica]|uniref:Uncharacterized protein n=1 Tax=Ficus carica TaxID=3494 RepID=A0AA88DR03_FICCA|nr:hypothetical protein TIFTF001_029003 [Ficus carica]